MTKKKYDDKSDKYSDWTSGKLMNEAKGLHYSINVSECYGTNDIIMLELVMRELGRRGLEPHIELAF